MNCFCKGRSHVCEAFKGLLRWDHVRKEVLIWQRKAGYWSLGCSHDERDETAVTNQIRARLSTAPKTHRRIDEK